jgi:hypothetical protein
MQEQLDEYGALDGLNCLWFIPPGVKFEWARREIPGVKDIEVGVKDRVSECVSNKGGIVFFLKEDSITSDNNVPTHWPFVFATPSLVTLSEEDIKELRIDNDDAPGQVTQWPCVDDMLKCPVCRTRAVADRVSVYVLACTQGLKMGNEGKIGAKMLWRFFCLDCFDSLGTSKLYIPDEGFREEDMPQSVMPFLEQGVSAPFGSMGYNVTPGNYICPPGQQAVPAYMRVSQFVRSGFHYCLSSDYNRYLTFMMGGKGGSKQVAVPGQTPSISSKCK